MAPGPDAVVDWFFKGLGIIMVTALAAAVWTVGWVVGEVALSVVGASPVPPSADPSPGQVVTYPVPGFAVAGAVVGTVVLGWASEVATPRLEAWYAHLTDESE